MALKAGLFGGDWEDYHDQNVQPLLDQYDQQINDILASGAHGEIVRMQAQDDALGANAGSGADDGQPQQVSYPLGGQAAAPVTSYGADPSFGRAHLDVGARSLAQLSPPGAALLGTSAYPQTVNLQDTVVPSASRFVIRDTGAGNLNPVANANGGVQDGVPRGDIYGGVATGFKGGGLAADAAAAVGSKIGAIGSGDKAVLQGLEGVTRRVISRPFAVAEGVADTAKDIHDGAPPAEAIIGNAIRSGTIYGAAALAGGLPGIVVGLGLDHVLPSGAVIGHTIINPTLPPDFDPSLFRPF